MSDLVQTPKSGWSRPENYVQWIVLAILAGAGVHFADLALPILNRVMENMILAVFLGLSLTAIGAILVSKDIHLLFWSYYRSGIKFFTNLLIRIDPVSILRDGIRRVKQNLKNMSASDAELASQQRALEEVIEENSKEYGENMKLMSAAKKRVAGGDTSMRGKMVLSGRQATRLQESNMTYQGLLNKIKGYRAMTARVREGAEVVVEDMEQTVKNEVIKRKMVRSAYKSLMNAKKVMQGDEQREMYDMALENLANDYFSKIGEMEQFMDESESFLKGMDLKNDVYDEDALAKLDEWEKKSGGILSVGKTRIRVDDGSEELIGRDDELEEAPKPEAKKRQSYANLFEIKK